MKIILDIDDTLAKTFAELERREGPADTYEAEDLRVMFPGIQLERYLGSIEFHRSIPPVEGAAKGVNWLLDLGHEAIYVSARPESMQAATQDWFEEWGFPTLPLYCLGREAKLQMLAEKPYDLLIDDQLRYLRAAEARGRRTLAVDYPWNASWDGPRIMNWGEIIGAI